MRPRTVLFLSLCVSLTATAAGAASEIAWKPWSKEVLDRAASEHRLVLLDVGAVWCHWCHVMDEVTYRDPAVVGLVKRGYLPVRVDQDADPALSARYEAWGWPATIILRPDGVELVKFKGYVPPERMASLLEEVLKDPTPGPSAEVEPEPEPARDAVLGAELRKQLLATNDAAFDEQFAGWGDGHKLVDAAPAWLALSRADAGDAREAARARRTLEMALQLQDPEWGGFYQYSDRRDWKGPHFEQLISIQADAIALYSNAYARWGDPEFGAAARKAAGFLDGFLSGPDGEFFVSMDADLSKQVDGHAYFARKDAQRRALGPPRVDRHAYARENGWAIAALAALHDATADRSHLDRAVKSARWVLAHRAVEGGGFRHGEPAADPLALGDTLAMAQAFLALARSTAEREWMDRAQRSADFMLARFAMPGGGAGFISSEPLPGRGVFGAPVRSLEENVAAARLFTALFHETGGVRYRDAAAKALRYLLSPGVVGELHVPGGVLLAEREWSAEPLHFTVVGPRGDQRTRALYAAARKASPVSKRTELWDPSEGPRRETGVTFPKIDRPALYVCGAKSCSRPVFDAEKVAAVVPRSG
ncbi:MAG TPA: DUF255 domain-containing protein [Myxococcaceae bacterium]|nr:DUF255 domain-containing protein [Myxococcaceae bacterium]